MAVVIDTLPRALSEGLLEFCRSIAPSKPRFVGSKPSSDAVQSFCFDNVEARIGRAGGATVFGWAIWHLRGAYYEAEHHGVWRKRSGELVDVSPQLNGYGKILFLPDETAVYDPARIRSNIIVAESDDPPAVELAAASRRRNEILDSYRMPGVSAAFLSPQDQTEHDLLLVRIQTLLLRFAR